MRMEISRSKLRLGAAFFAIYPILLSEGQKFDVYKL